MNKEQEPWGGWCKYEGRKNNPIRIIWNFLKEFRKVVWGFLKEKWKLWLLSMLIFLVITIIILLGGRGEILYK